MNPIIDRLFKACEGAGYVMLEQDKAAILAAADGCADDALNKAVTAFADNLPSGGVKSLEFDGIKSALIASEPDFDAIANQKIAYFLDAVANGLNSASRT